MRKPKKAAGSAPAEHGTRSRSRAKILFAGKRPTSMTGKITRSPSKPDPITLLHNLQIHQIELELQNEELRSARLELERALGSYTELFDFAPIGYISIGADRVVSDINHAGAQLLGIARATARGRAVEQLVPPSSRTKLRNLLLSAEINPGRQSCELELLRAGAA